MIMMMMIMMMMMRLMMMLIMMTKGIKISISKCSTNSSNKTFLFKIPIDAVDCSNVHCFGCQKTAFLH